MAKISDNIKKYRTKHNLSQTKFANRLHVTKQAVSKWETGRGYPDSSLIPVIAKELGISIDSLMGTKRIKKKMIVLIIIAFVLIVTMILIIPKVVNYYQEVQEYNEFKEEIENIIGLDLPDKGKLVYADFEDWTFYGNTIPIHQMSYLVFTSENQTITFENDFVDDSRWVGIVDDGLIELLPINIRDYATVGDYYLIYNIDTDTYNDLSINSGAYSMLFLIYQKDNNRLIVFDYLIQFEGGN
ncbi:MAG: helix-turn-helix domain-containing protein [Candidatus Izimaplasma sp.]|nr:helix-turn-helix domain-containing protein [Candidatus Izimaplasma bacterium]